jgi:hypothetical protein
MLGTLYNLTENKSRTILREVDIVMRAQPARKGNKIVPTLPQRMRRVPTRCGGSRTACHPGRHAT